MSALDAHLREVEFPSFEGNTKELFKGSAHHARLQALRRRWNELVHFKPSKEAVTVDDFYLKSDTLEQDAREAVRLTIDVVFETPWV